MRRLTVLVMFALLYGASGCGGGHDAGPSGTDTGVGAAADTDAGSGSGNKTVPSCPFTAAQVSDLIGQPMTDEGNCLFGDGKGVASLTVTVASELAGSATYNYQRQQAEQTYREVKDIDKGDKGYLAVKDIGGEAVVVGDAGSYTLILDSFERLSASPGGYEQTLRKLLDALPA
jgi:hypothetical protein